MALAAIGPRPADAQQWQPAGAPRVLEDEATADAQPIAAVGRAWRPVRPAAPREAVATAFAEDRMAAAESAFNDPFGDRPKPVAPPRKRAYVAELPAAALPDNPLPQSQEPRLPAPAETVATPSARPKTVKSRRVEPLAIEPPAGGLPAVESHAAEPSPAPRGQWHAVNRPDDPPGTPSGPDAESAGRVPSYEALNALRRTPVDECRLAAERKSIGEITNEITAEKGDFPAECSLARETFHSRRFPCKTYTWTASAECHKPVYFEDEQLERYGHAHKPVVQAFASGARFFLTFPALPYLMGVDPPKECKYVLGTYEPGSCAPYMVEPVPISARAGLMEAGAWVGGAALLP